MLRSEHCLLLNAHSAVYVDIAKNASSSIKFVLAGVLGLGEAGTVANPHELPFPHPPQPDPFAAPAFPGRFTFAFVRNPWDRLLSCYRDKVAGEPRPFTEFTASGVARCLARFGAFHAGMSFAAFVDAVCAIPDEQADEHFRSQYCFVVNADGRVAVDFVGRVERLADDFRVVAEHIRLRPRVLPRLQAGAAIDYRSHYDATSRDRVARRFQRDIELFSYRFG